MGRTITLAELRKRVLQTADMEAQTATGMTGFLSPEEVTQYINDSLSELHDVLVLRFSDWVVRRWRFALVSNQEEYPLPADFYRLRALYLISSVDATAPSRTRLSQFMEEERDRAGDGEPKYRIEDGVLCFAPPPTSGAVELRYVYQAPVLVHDNDQVWGPLILGWIDYAVVDAAIKCRDKGDLPTDRLNGRKAALYKRIEVAAADRDISSPQRVVDVNSWRFA